MKQQTFVAGFSAGAGAKAGGIGYSEKISPTLKGTASGNCMPSVLCLNDQGGSVMDCTVGITGTLRAQEHGHQPLVYENHGIDADTPGHTPLPRRSPPVQGPEATICRWWNRETRLTGRLLKRTAFFMPDSV